MSGAGERIEPWSKLPCSECGVEGLAARAYPVEGPYVCEGCEGHARGVAVGLQARDGLPYEVKLADDGSALLAELLEARWEPYAAVVDIREWGQAGSDVRGTYPQIVHVLRRRRAPEAT